MCKVLCFTSRELCREDFLERIRLLAGASPAGIVLREKDLSEQEYLVLARQVQKICERWHVPCILHGFADAAIKLHAKAVHLPLPVLRGLTQAQKAAFSCIGASCHCVEEAQEAQALGCTYLTAGHIFETGCKKGLPGRGVQFLKDVADAVEIPVFAIGGITPETVKSLRGTGAKGVCIMSAAMQRGDVRGYLNQLERGMQGGL